MAFPTQDRSQQKAMSEADIAFPTQDRSEQKAMSEADIAHGGRLQATASTPCCSRWPAPFAGHGQEAPPRGDGLQGNEKIPTREAIETLLRESHDHSPAMASRRRLGHGKQLSLRDSEFKHWGATISRGLEKYTHSFAGSAAHSPATASRRRSFGPLPDRVHTAADGNSFKWLAFGSDRR